MTPDLLRQELDSRTMDLAECCRQILDEEDINGIQQMGSRARTLGVEIDYYAEELFKALERSEHDKSQVTSVKEGNRSK